MNQRLTWRQRGWLWLRLGLRLVLAALLILFFWKVLPPVLELTMPFVLALVLAWALNPMIRGLQKKLHIRRGVLSLVLMLLVIAVVGGILTALVYSLVSQVVSFLQNWQTAWADAMLGVNTILQGIEDLLYPLPGQTHEQMTALGDRLTAWLGETVSGLLAQAAGGAGSFAMSIPAWAIGVVIFIMATYLISADYPHLRSMASQRVPEELRAFFSQLKRVAQRAFGGYVKAQIILSAAIFFILLIGFFCLGEPYALLLAFILAVMDFIPIIGSGTAMVPWAVLDVALGNYKHAIGLMVVWGIIAVFRRVAEPKVVGDQTGLSPIASLVSIYVGMRLAGVVGMVLGPALCLIALNMAQTGIFDNTLRDLRLAFRDIGGILKGSQEDRE